MPDRFLSRLRTLLPVALVASCAPLASAGDATTASPPATTTIANSSAHETPVAGASTPGDDWMRLRIQPYVLGRKSVTTAEVLEQLNALFTASDIEGKGISDATYDLAKQIARSQSRARTISEILSRDLDNNGTVTRAELEVFFSGPAHQPMRAQSGQVAPTPEQARQIRDKLVSVALQPDKNGDGIITFDEMRAFADAQIKDNDPGRFIALQQIPLSLDTDGDGTVSRAEFEASAIRVLAEISRNGDGNITEDDIAANRERFDAANKAEQARESDRRNAASFADKIARCKLPAPPEGAKLMLLGVDSGAALSNVSIGGDNGLPVSAIHVKVEDGEQPLYVVAVSRTPTLWYLTGATSRVAMFVASDAGGAMGAFQVKATPHTGVSGLDPAHVNITKTSDCLSAFTDSHNATAKRTESELKALLGRSTDNVVGTMKVARIAVPSGILATDSRFPISRILPTTGAGAQMWRRFTQLFPAGVADLEPSTVVAAFPVQRYAQLPQEAGLAELLDDKAIEITAWSRAVVLGNVTIITGREVRGTGPESENRLPSELRIVRKMHFPPMVNLAGNMKFKLATGVPAPEGDARGLCVMSEETGQPLSGNCR